MTIKTNVSWDKTSKAGGFSAICNGKMVSGGLNNTTRQRCELEAVIRIVSKLPVYAVRTDVQLGNPSRYLCNGIKNFRNYRSRGFITFGGQEFANQDLWNQLIKVGNAHNIKLIPPKSRETQDD